jgi:hypothetical protein
MNPSVCIDNVEKQYHEWITMNFLVLLLTLSYGFDNEIGVIRLIHDRLQQQKVQQYPKDSITWKIKRSKR